uniref:Uncharacterized protein n=1 Tax=Triticum urartu TaxID=4572 RepID=A0A8R7TDI7_TRIUA
MMPLVPLNFSYSTTYPRKVISPTSFLCIPFFRAPWSVDCPALLCPVVLIV